MGLCSFGRLSAEGVAVHVDVKTVGVVVNKVILNYNFAEFWCFLVLFGSVGSRARACGVSLRRPYRSYSTSMRCVHVPTVQISIMGGNAGVHVGQKFLVCVCVFVPTSWLYFPSLCFRFTYTCGGGGVSLWLVSL